MRTRTFLMVSLTCVASCGREALGPVKSLAPVVASLDRPEDEGGFRDRPDGTNFETFPVGAIDGQFDWKSLGGASAAPPANPLDTHCVVYDHVIADNSAIGVLYRYAGFGRHSLRISNAVTSSCYSDQTFSSRTANPAGQLGATSRSRNGLIDYALPGGTLRNHFDAEWTFASTVPTAEQVGLQVVASPARGDDHRMSWVQMADLPDGLAVVVAERSSVTAPGAFALTTVVRRLDRRVPHTIRLTIDFRDGPGNDLVRVYVDDELKHTGTSWENYYAYDANGMANFGGNTPAVNRLMFRTGSDSHRGIPGDAAPLTRGRGFVIDHVRVSTSLVDDDERQSH
jgi:hypothetical protein